MKYGPGSREKSIGSKVLAIVKKLIGREKAAPRELMISSSDLAEILRKEKYKEK